MNKYMSLKNMDVMGYKIFADNLENIPLDGKIFQLSSDADLQRELKKNGYMQSERFSWRKTVQETLIAYSLCYPELK